MTKLVRIERERFMASELRTVAILETTINGNPLIPLEFAIALDIRALEEFSKMKPSEFIKQEATKKVKESIAKAIADGKFTSESDLDEESVYAISTIATIEAAVEYLDKLHERGLLGS